MTTDKKRYWLFAGSKYYPEGGMMDFIMSADTIDYNLRPEKTGELGSMSVYSRLDKMDDFNWYHIFDSETGRVIESCDDGEDTLETQLFDNVQGRANG